MTKNQDIRHGRHCVFMLHVHLVFVTKYRRDVFSKTILNDLKETFDFAASCGGAPLEIIKQYIQQQDTPH